MNPLDDGSNSSALLVLGAAILIGSIAAAIRATFLPIFDPNSGAEVIPLRPCTCGGSWCDYKPNVAQKDWWKP